jgi:hypothetical protein
VPRTQLTNPDDEALFIYEDFLSHNELGLALDALPMSRSSSAPLAKFGERLVARRRDGA